MRFIQYLNEKYVTLGEYPIFVNPTPKEMKEALHTQYGDCRFFVDVEKKNFYVWSSEQLHQEVSNILNTEGIHNKYPHNGLKEIWGVASLRNNKLEISSAYLSDISSPLAKNIELKENYYKNLKWISKWFGDNFLDYVDKYVQYREGEREDWNVMRFIEYLSDEYVATGPFPIFVNPTPKELRETLKYSSCRFFVDVVKNYLYVWDYRLLHREASNILNKEGIHNKYPFNNLKEIWGVASLKNNKPEVISVYMSDILSHIGRDKKIRDKFYHDIKFVSKWFGESLLNKIEFEMKPEIDYWRMKDGISEEYSFRYGDAKTHK